jgi:curli biogenesis system outer membrane secretion channel CsgG
MFQLKPFVGITIIVLICGCKSGSQQSLVSTIGSYAPAPAVTNHAKLGITPFKIEDDQPSQSPQALSNVAADEMGRLILRSGRFDVVDRTNTAEILERNNLTGIVRPGRFLQSAAVPGIDYLLLGTLSNLRIQREVPPPEEDGVMNKVKSFANKLTKNDEAMVSADCTVAIQIVDAATGDVVVFNNSELQQTVPASSMGMDVMQTGSGATTQPRVSESDRAAVARLALDDALRKSLPKIDRFLASRQTTLAQSMPTTAPVAPASAPLTSTPTVAPNAAVKICPNCGAENDRAAKFCKRCGAKL